MANELENKVWDALKAVRFPGMSRDIVSFGFVQRVAVTGERAAVELVMQTQNPGAADRVREEVERAVVAIPGLSGADVTMNVKAPPETPHRAVVQAPALAPGVRHMVAVASGKGGVSKSTVAANLAVKLAQLRHSVGILDIDLRPVRADDVQDHRQAGLMGNRVLPFERYGVR